MSPEHVVLGCDVCVLKNPLCPAHPGPPCGPESQLIVSSSCLDLHHPYQPSFHGLFSGCHNLTGLDVFAGQKVCSRKGKSVTHE